MILFTPGWIFTVLAAFAELVGREAAAAIRRKQADDAKKKKIAKKKAKAKAAAEKAYEKEAQKKAKEAAARKIKSDRVKDDVTRRLKEMHVDAEPNPYKPGPPDASDR